MDFRKISKNHAGRKKKKLAVKLYGTRVFATSSQIMPERREKIRFGFPVLRLTARGKNRSIWKPVFPVGERRPADSAGGLFGFYRRYADVIRV